uniref:RING-type E3 ubiquitin transferase n=1 Tax=Hyaloperonospora arabidopsidis (strain Emoy2) TaxID=559515 RepID=M4BN70_HYAAE
MALNEELVEFRLNLDVEEKQQRSARVDHAAGEPTAALCRFFVLGKCIYGSRCTFSHTLPHLVSDCTVDEAERLSAAAALVDCPFFLRGKCKFGEHCRLRHDPMMLSRPAAATCSAVSKPAAISTTFPDNEQEFTCGICFDDIVQSGKHFGLLSCDHCFCLECLRSWRQSKEMELVRACPACRFPSDYIVPSLTFCIGEEKRKIVEAYKSHLALRECKYFNGLLGSCPFGPRCFYAHLDASGRDVKHLDRPKRRTKQQRSRRDHEDGDAMLQSLLERYNHLFHFFEDGDRNDSSDSDDLGDSEEDYIEAGFSDNEYDTE